MKNKMITQQLINNDESWKIFIEVSINRFNEDLLECDFQYQNEGIVKVEIVLYFLWLMDKNIFKEIKFVWNHEGIWEFHLKSENKELKSKIIRVLHYQYIDSIDESNPEFKIIP